MDVFRQKNEREEEEEEVQIQIWNLNVVKEPNIIKFSSHKFNSKIEVSFGFYIFSGIFEYIKGD